jgi:hypothetical protein
VRRQVPPEGIHRECLAHAAGNQIVKGIRLIDAAEPELQHAPRHMHEPSQGHLSDAIVGNAVALGSRHVHKGLATCSPHGADAAMRGTSSPRSMAGSPRASTPRISGPRLRS